MAEAYMADLPCSCENGGSFRSYAQYGSYGSLCTSCGAHGWATSLIAILPDDHSKARMSVDGFPGEEVVGPVSAYQDWIMERAGSGIRVWIDRCPCERCGGSILVEVADQRVTERCTSCQQVTKYESTVPLPKMVPMETRHYRVRHPHPNAEVIALVRKMISPGLDVSLQTVKERLVSEEGVVITCLENAIASDDRYMDLYVRDCQLEAISPAPRDSTSE